MATIKRILCAFLVALVGFTAFFVPVAAKSAYAAESSVPFDETDVLNDLKGSTIGGKPFDVNDYPHNGNADPQIIAFAEFCFSYYENKQDDYAFYVYVYNPQDVAFDTDTERNKIQFSTGKDSSYHKYPLDFVRYSEGAGLEGRFFKFKVRLTESERSKIWRSVEENRREYRISGIELSVGGVVEEYGCKQVYTYSGFALGYGSPLAENDTLTCTVDGLETCLSLDVRSTYYRPKGTNGEGYTQDTLHSVYFSVSNAVIEEYGEMTAVHATWLNARTEPIVVTGNQDVFNAISPFIGIAVDGGKFQYASDDNSPIRYALLAGAYNESASWNHASHGHAFVSYNANSYYTNSDKAITTLQYIFLADNGDADAYTLPAEALIGNKADGVKGYFETYTKKFGGALVDSKYSKALFESVADEFTDITISADESFTLTDEIVSQNLWQKFVGGGYNVTGKNSYTVSAIKKVEDSDFRSTAAETCKGLYIDESDYNDFKSYYDDAKKHEKTVYLFRYYQSDYSAYESIEYERGKGDWTLLGTVFDYNFVDTNAYFFQMWVQLDFDIIDLTFTKDNVSTVIPVIMSPMDIAADATPPVVTTKNNLKWWQILLAVILVVLLIILLWKFLLWILQAIVWVILLPFKLIAALCKAISNSVKKRRRKKEEKAQQSQAQQSQAKKPPKA